MKTHEVIAQVDAQRQVRVTLPVGFAANTVRVLVFAPDAGEDATGEEWARGIAREWAEELGDAREDIYTLADGEPVDAAR